MVGVGRGPAALRRAARRMGARRASSCASSPASTAMRRRGARRSTPTTPTRESPPRSGRPSRALGFTGGRVLEPGCGAGIFLGLAPAEARARRRRARPHHRGNRPSAVPRRRHPRRVVRAHTAAGRLLRPRDRERAVRRRAPARPAPQPRRPQPAQPLHPQVPAPRPGRAGWSPCSRSHYTLDAANPAARREMSALADLVGAVRLPTGAHRRSGRHRRADGPADPPPPPPRRARARDELGEHPAGRRRRPPSADQQLPGRAPAAASSAS